MAITVEKASLADLETLNKIEQRCFTKEAFSKRQIATLLKAPNAVNFLAKSDGEIVGFIVGLIYNEDESRIGHIFTIDVAPEHRRKGIGMKLLDRTEKELAELGAKTCYLEVRTDNVAAKELYKRLGYVEVERLKDFYYRGGHGIRLKKPLSL